MIVHKVWKTEKWMRSDGITSGHFRKFRWEGWFLFGFIPIYMKRTIVAW